MIAKEEKIFFNELEGSIVSISPVTKRMKSIQPYTPFGAYRSFNTCQVEQGLFQLSDEVCQVLVPNFKTRKFTIEERMPIPAEAKWSDAATVAIPGPNPKVMVIGPIWDQYNHNPWVHDLNENSWSNTLTPDSKTLPSLPENEDEILHGSAIFMENKVYLFRSKFVYILDLSALETWEVVELAQSHWVGPVSVPFSPTEVAIVGGTGKTPFNIVSVFNTTTNSSQKLAPQTNELGVESAYQ